MLMRLSSEILELLTLSKYNLADLGPAYIYNDAFLTIPSEQVKRVFIEYQYGIYSHQLKIWHPYPTKSTEIGDFYLTEAEFEKNATTQEFTEYRNQVVSKISPMLKCLSDKYHGKRKIYTEVMITVDDIFVIPDEKIVKKLDLAKQTMSLYRCLDPEDDLYCYEVDMGLKMHTDLFINKEGNSKHSVQVRAKKWMDTNAPEIGKTENAVSRVATTFNPHKKDDQRYKVKEKLEKNKLPPPREPL